jgi:uncharacterized membrane protein YqiK
MVFGHQIRSIIPAHQTAFADKWKAVMDARDRQAEIDAAVKTRYNASTKPLSRFPLGAQVRIQDPKSKKMEPCRRSSVTWPLSRLPH